jgi:ribonuclease HI
VASAAQAEISACDEAVRAVADWGMMHVIIETDSQNLVRAMRGTDFDRAPEGVIYRDLRLFMQLSFNSFEFSYVPRTCNTVAHSLAAYGASRHELKLLWPDSLPNDVTCYGGQLFSCGHG